MHYTDSRIMNTFRLTITVHPAGLLCGLEQQFERGMEMLSLSCINSLCQEIAGMQVVR